LPIGLNAILSKDTFKLASDAHLTTCVAANANLFAERRETFLRYDGTTLVTQLQSLPPMTDQYFKRLIQDGIKTEKSFNKRINEDRGSFDPRGDRFWGTSSDVRHLKHLHDILSKLREVIPLHPTVTGTTAPADSTDSTDAQTCTEDVKSSDPDPTSSEQDVPTAL
jgi:hypothetical protein